MPDRPAGPLTRQQLLVAFERLSEILAGRGLKADIYVVGGAAMVLAFDARPATRDVDAVFKRRNEVFKAAAQVSREQGLPDGWLNDSAARFLGRPDRRSAPALDLPGLRVMAASPEYLLAMKILADRHDRDRDDIRLLVRRLGISTLAQVEAIYAEVYPFEGIAPDTRLRLEEILAEIPPPVADNPPDG